MNSTRENYKELTKQVMDIAKEVASYIGQQQQVFRKDKVQTKSRNDFVSYVDQEAEKQLVKKLGELFPNAGFITEEGTVEQGGGAYCWVIDPLDGTTNFIHNSTPYAVSIALVHNMQPVVGVIHEVTRNETFYAWEGSKAYMNGTEIQVSDTRTLQESLLCTGRPHNYLEKLDALVQSFAYFLDHSHGLRTTGSAAADLAYVACGRFDGRYEFGLKPWDIAAGVLLVQQAGGQVCDFNGGNAYFKTGDIIAGNAHITRPLQLKINQIFGA